MTHRATLKRAFLAALLIAAAFVLTSTPGTEAAIGNTYCIYYSDASHSQVVGECGPDCCGRRTCWGTTSQFAVCGAFNCVWCPPDSSVE